MANNNSVNVYLRIRPTQIWEAASPAKTYIDYNTSADNFLVLENQPFAFDHIFYSSSTQNEVFQKIEPSVSHLLEGFNSCVFAYGQSGTGKTYTMGLNEKNNAGLITLALDALFNQLRAKNHSSDPAEFEVNISYIEIYNEKVYDLLDSSNESIYTKGSKYAGSKQKQIYNSQDAKDILAKGNKNRHVRSTIINATSSRSHAMFSIFLKMRTMNAEIGSVLHLVDLAGSEGLRNTGHKGIAQQEGIHINQGLLAVGKVIQALSSSKKLVPYRDSVLTTVLQDCLNADAFLSLIATISPSRKDRSETLSTIRFAQSCKTLENKMLPEMNAYLKQKQRLQARTPLKPYMLPLSRNESTVKTPGKVLAKTPGKISTAVNRATGTIKKQPASVNRFNSFNIPSIRVQAGDPVRYSELQGASDTTKESIDNQTFMNISTSTEFEEPLMQHPNITNIMSTPAMPSFSPLMRQIEATIDKKITSLMNSFINQTAAPADATRHLKNDVRHAVMNGIQEIRDASGVDDEEATFAIADEAVCSTVLKKPFPSLQNQDDKVSMPPPAALPASRINRRLMTRDFNSPAKMFNADAKNQTVIPQRRSRRISMMQEIRMSKENVVPKVEKKGPKTISRNKVVDSYFNNSSGSIKNITKKDHQQAILEMMNTGSVKELQLLPMIGPKTAYQVVTHRLVKGKYKNFDEVKKALMMKPKTWEKFLEKNLLS